MLKDMWSRQETKLTSLGREWVEAHPLKGWVKTPSTHQKARLKPIHQEVGSKPPTNTLNCPKSFLLCTLYDSNSLFFSGFVTLMRYFVDRFIIVSTLLTENTSRTKRLRWRDEREREQWKHLRAISKHFSRKRLNWEHIVIKLWTEITKYKITESCVSRVPLKKVLYRATWKQERKVFVCLFWNCGQTNKGKDLKTTRCVGGLPIPNSWSQCFVQK